MTLVYLSSCTVSMTFVVAFLGVLLIQAQDQSGFISIDCGAPAGVSYTEPTTGINYTSDANLISTGEIGKIVPELKTEYLQQLWTLRSFPKGKRNCYIINITRGSKYLIRTGSLYGNYDGLNKLPQFDIFLGVNWWYTVTIEKAAVSQNNEIIHVPYQDYIHICLVNTDQGTPFISYIELRTLTNDIYVTEFGSLERYHRWDLGSDKTHRYKEDVYGRFWFYGDDNNDWTKLNVSTPADSLDQSKYEVPAIVMSTAVTPANASAPLIISWQPEHPTDQFYVCMHFMEIQVLPQNQTREFNITLNGKLWYQNLSPRYWHVTTIFSRETYEGEEIIYSLEMTKNSTLPPIISAIEIFRVIDFQQPDTFQGDVDAITIIKSVYEVTRDTWQGDPCRPLDYLWDGLNCTNGGNDSPRITTLNLSSSGLSGKIDPSISNLTMLEKLDLSNNSLNGEVPDFLSQLQHLKILNLEKNNLSGLIPSALVEKFKKGSLSLSFCQIGIQNLEDWQKARSLVPNENIYPTQLQVNGWQFPPPDWLKCNVGAAFFSEEAMFGAGMYIRDESGFFLQAAAVKLEGYLPVHEGEAMALLHTIKWLIALSIDKVIIETDCLRVVQSINVFTPDISEYDIIISQIRNVIDALPNYKISWVRRQANLVAHTIAMGAKDLASHQDFYDVPDCIAAQILHESK